jgi:hypothetical protein
MTPDPLAAFEALLTRYGVPASLAPEAWTELCWQLRIAIISIGNQFDGSPALKQKADAFLRTLLSRDVTLEEWMA